MSGFTLGCRHVVQTCGDADGVSLRVHACMQERDGVSPRLLKGSASYDLVFHTCLPSCMLNGHDTSPEKDACTHMINSFASDRQTSAPSRGLSPTLLPMFACQAWPRAQWTWVPQVLVAAVMPTCESPPLTCKPGRQVSSRSSARPRSWTFGTEGAGTCSPQPLNACASVFLWPRYLCESGFCC